MNSSSQPEYITIGTVGSPWGLRGHFKVEIETDFPRRFSVSSLVYIGGKPAVIREAEWQGRRPVIRIDGVDSEEDAGNLAGQPVEIHRTQLYELPEGVYYHFQLAGLSVKTTGGKLLGEITDILTVSGADIYVITGQNGEILIPAVDDIVKSVNLEEGYMVIEPIEGLLDLNEKKSK